ncbi:MAG: hypothetical protein GEU95_01100 [Rhizobiales bacterium]|nr:hypothetical protein [Hyphomicrobiales bacterium]
MGRNRNYKNAKDIREQPNFNATKITDGIAVRAQSEAFARALLATPEGNKARRDFLKRGNQPGNAYPRYRSPASVTPYIRSNADW